eukprot:scaffold24311_cov196-Cylindrotheca_fusiformis.AAC.1
MSAARSSGSKLVAVAVAGTVGVVGLSTIYLPFFSDRDAIRGMHEEQAPPTSAMLAQEIKKLQQEGIIRGDEEDQSNIPKQKAPGSMWKNLRK